MQSIVAEWEAAKVITRMLYIAPYFPYSSYRLSSAVNLAFISTS